MPKSKSRIQVVKSLGDPFEVLDEEKRREVEANFGHRLRWNTWLYVMLITAYCSMLNVGISSPIPKNAFVKKLEQLIKHATSVRNDLTSNDLPTLPKQAARGWKFGNRVLAEIQKRQIVDFKKEAASDSFPFTRDYYLVGALDTLIVIADWIRQDFADPEYRNFSPELAWDIWVCMLTDLLKEVGLPTRVSKAQIDPRSKTSPFLLFIKSLQANYPKFKRHFHSDQALAQAISRARKNHQPVDFDQFTAHVSNLLEAQIPSLYRKARS